ncbi:unnamed protein product [Pedinophyceae sp. YPF-701]|nr:unnamed protein product [Pedinophyceae sp. YPF-701]
MSLDGDDEKEGDGHLKRKHEPARCEAQRCFGLPRSCTAPVFQSRENDGEHFWLCQSHYEEGRDASAPQRQPRTVSDEGIRAALRRLWELPGCDLHRLAGKGALSDSQWQEVIDLAGNPTPGQPNETFQRAVVRALRHYADRGGMRSTSAFAGDVGELAEDSLSDGRASRVEVHTVPGCHGPLVVHHQHAAVARWFPAKLIRDVRKLQATDEDASGEHTFLTAFAQFQARSVEEVWKDMTRQGAKRPSVTKIQAAETLARLHKALQGFMADVRDTVIAPYLRCLNAAPHMCPENICDGFFLDYRSASDAEHGAGLGGHVDGGTWTLLVVLPALPREEWRGCELVFNCDADLAAGEGSRLRRTRFSGLGPATEKGALRMRPIRRADGAATDEVWTARLQGGDVVCQGNGLEHAVNDLDAEFNKGKARRHSLALFMGFPVGRAPEREEGDPVDVRHVEDSDDERPRRRLRSHCRGGARDV